MAVCILVCCVQVDYKNPPTAGDKPIQFNPTVLKVTEATTVTVDVTTYGGGSHTSKSDTITVVVIFELELSRTANKGRWNVVMTHDEVINDGNKCLPERNNSLVWNFCS